MPKQKTHSGMKKRIKISGTGKLSHEQTNKRHNLEKKSSSRTRRITGDAPIAHVDVRRVKRLLGR